MQEVNYSGFLGVAAFTSAAPMDFMKGDPSSECYVLTAAQQAYVGACGIPAARGVILPKQVHGDVVWRVGPGDEARSGLVEADAVVTDSPGLPIAIRTADCLPLLMFDPRRRVIAAVHAGWKSTRLNIAAKAIDLMRENYGVRPEDIRAAVGPCIRRESCEVGPEFREYFPQETFETPKGLRFDIFRANLRQMTGRGMSPDHIFDSGLCSFSDPVRFHSFRREAERSGRMLSVIMLPAGERL